MPNPRPLDYRSGEPPPRHKPVRWREWAAALIVGVLVLLIATVLFVVLAGIVIRGGLIWR